MAGSDVIFVGVGTNDRWTSRLIRWATGSWCSHAWIEYSSLSCGGIWAIQATPDGVVRTRILDVLAAYPVHRRFALVDVDANLVRVGIREAIDELGAPYDYGVIGNALRLARWRVTGRASALRRNPAALHCSELVSLTLKAIGVSHSDQLDPEAVHPGKLFTFIFDHPNFREV